MLNGKPVMGNYVGTKNPPSENDFSIGLRIRYKNFVYVTMGDLDGQYEDSFNAVYDGLLISTVVMVSCRLFSAGVRTGKPST